MAEPRPDRLRELDDAAFESFIRRFAETAWNGWEIAMSPPSPDRSVDVRLSHGDYRELLHVKHRPAESSVGAPAVSDLAALRDRREFESVVRLSAYRETQPSLDGLLSDLEPRVERAIERSS